LTMAGVKAVTQIEVFDCKKIVVNERDRFMRNVLHYCSLNGKHGTEMLKRLVERHSMSLSKMLNDQDELSNSPLIYAFCTGNDQLLEYLLSHGGKVNSEFETRYLFLNFKIIPKILESKFREKNQSITFSSIQDDSFQIDKDFTLFEQELMMNGQEKKVFRQLVRRFGTRFDDDDHDEQSSGEKNKKRNTQNESRRRLEDKEGKR